MSKGNLIPVQIPLNHAGALGDSNRLTSNVEVSSMEVDVNEHQVHGESAIITIQPDWYFALREENGKAWITFKQRGQLGLHSQLLSEGESTEGNVFNVTCDDEFNLGRITHKSLELSHKKVSKLVFKIIRPEKVFESIHGKNVSTLDVSSGGLGVSAGDDGSSLFVWETFKGVVRRKLEGHYGDIYNCKLFPSGVVILSSGADMRIKIWSATDGSCPVTLTGHVAPVTDTAIVDKGMNIVSTSKDGSVRIWSCGKAKCLEPPIHVDDVINCCDIGTTERNGFHIEKSNEDSIDREHEVGLESKIVAVGMENGTLAIVGLLNREVLAKTKVSGEKIAINAISFFKESLLLVGCESGKVMCFSLPDLKVFWALHDSDSSVMSLLSLPNLNGFLVGKLDGTCGYYTLNSNGQLSNTRVLLSGADTDPINTIKSDGTYIYTGARDGKIRKYNIYDI